MHRERINPKHRQIGVALRRTAGAFTRLDSEPTSMKIPPRHGGVAMKARF